MKKTLFFYIVVVLAGISFWIWATQAVSQDAIQEKEIYLFTQKTCPHCWAAEAYLKEKYPSLSIQSRDISDQQNRALFFACGEKFGLSKIKMGTPLFCMGEHYIMGWNQEEQNKFDTYVQDFLPSK